MKERNKSIGQKAKDDATMNFVSRQAQEAILDPNLPESYKDEVLEFAIGIILRIAERRKAYNARAERANSKAVHHGIRSKMKESDKKEI